MSLLINESYASSSTPLWASSSGGIITGDLDVSGTLSAPEFDVALANGTPVGARMTGSGGVDGIMYLQATQIKFARLSELGNTTFTPSATGSNLDNLTVGGIVSAVSITPATVVYPGSTNIGLNAGPITLSATTPYGLVSGREYDIQLTGYVAIGAGATTPAVGDSITLTVQTGSGTVPGYYTYRASDVQYPADVNNVWAGASFHQFSVRSRLLCNATGNMVIFADFVGTGTYPANLCTVVVLNCDVVRLT
jgi:hypothetical protein